MTSDYQLTSEYKAKAEYELSKEHRLTPPFCSQEQREHWRAGGKLPDMHVDIGLHDGVLGLNPFTRIAFSRYALATEEGIVVERRTIGKRFVMAIGKLCVCVCMGQGNERIPMSLRDLAIDDQDWNWPDSASVSYEDFFRLFEPDFDNEIMIRLMSNLELRRKIEEHSRQVGSFREPPETSDEIAAAVRAMGNEVTAAVQAMKRSRLEEIECIVKKIKGSAARELAVNRAGTRSKALNLMT